MEFFLEKIASHIYEEYGGRLETQCMIFPNRRAGLYFLKYLAAKAGKPVWAPAVKTINELFGSTSSLRQAETETLIFELYRIYRNLNPGAEKFDDFYFWGELLLNDFDDVDKYLADPAKLFENLSDIKRIDEKFGVLSDEQINAVRQFWTNFNDGARTAQKDDFLRIWSILPRLYSGFRESLSTKGIAYEGMIFRELAEKCRDGHLPVYKWNNFHFAGFNALNECEKILMHTMKNDGLARFYWDYDLSYGEKKSTHSAGFFIRNNLKEFGNDMPDDWEYITKLSSGEGNTRSRIIETSSDIAQVKLIPELLRDMNEINGKEAHHTAIVLADESLLVPMLSTVPEFISDVNVTMGYPLRLSQVYSLVRHLLSLQKNCREEGQEVLFDHRDVLNIIRHNYYSSDPELNLRKLIPELVSEKRRWIPGSRFAGMAPLDSIFQKASTPVLLSGYIKSILQGIFITGTDEEVEGVHATSETRICNEFIYRALLAINRLDNIISASDISLSVATWTRLLDRIIKSISIPFSGEPLSGIQIMGLLETRALDFRNLIILSANEGVLPGTSFGSSYIPYNLREAYGLPGIKHQDSIYAYYFYRLLHRVENITFVYNSSSEGVKTGEMSRYLLQLTYLHKPAPEMTGLGCEIISPARMPGTLERSRKHIEKLKKLFLIPGGKSVSPSAVNAWLNCRMKFFYKYICELKEPEKILQKIDPAMFGALLHGIMQRIYSSSIGSLLNISMLESILHDHKSINGIIREVISTSWFNGNEKWSDGNVQIISNILKSYVGMIIRFDQSVGPLQIAGLEKKVSSPVEISCNGENIKITAGGYIDRLDVAGGIFRIIDYKTGSMTMEIPSVESLFDETDDKRNEAWFQILMYCEIFSAENIKEKVRPSLYALRNLPGKNFSDYLLIGKETGSRIRVEDYAQIREAYSGGLRRTLETIFDNDSDFTMTGHQQKCEYCAFRQLCNR
jgi:PD-(D/E)XK nuclease superfamily